MKIFSNQMNSGSRRKFFKTTGRYAAASVMAGGLMPRAFAAEKNIKDISQIERSDAAMIGPKDNIKVTKIESFVLKNTWVFVKISTDAGITGWGEMLKDDSKACAAGALEVGDYLIGKDPLRVAHHWQAIHRAAFYRGGPVKTAIQSGIDQALWDITGKAYGVPVYKLLGGPTRDRMRVYGRPDPVTGVTAMKTQLSDGERIPYKYAEGRKFVDAAVERFAALRQKVGPQIDIGVEFHGAVPPLDLPGAYESSRAI